MSVCKNFYSTCNNELRQNEIHYKIVAGGGKDINREIIDEIWQRKRESVKVREREQELINGYL